MAGFADGMKYRLAKTIDGLLRQPFPAAKAQLRPNSPSAIPSITVSSKESDLPIRKNNIDPESRLHTRAETVTILLTALLDIDPLRSSPGTLSSIHSLLKTLVRLKPDLPHDILQIVATTPSDHVRFRALCLLHTYWPTSVGHMLTGESLPQLDYDNERAQAALQVSSLPTRARPNPHKWITWLYPEHSLNSTVATTGQVAPSSLDVLEILRCNECNKPVQGFALRCVSGHHNPVHLQCHVAPEDSSVIHYAAITGQTKLSFPKYRIIDQNVRASVFTNIEEGPLILTIGDHRFRLVTIFTCTLCCLCKNPIWCEVVRAPYGLTKFVHCREISQQGYRCFNCSKFGHLICLSQHTKRLPACVQTNTLQISDITIASEVVSQSFKKHYADLPTSRVSLERLSKFELVIFHHLLQTQIWMLESGIAGATLVIERQRKSSNFELYKWLRSYSESIASRGGSLPPAIDTFCSLTAMSCSSDLLANDAFLDHCVAQIHAELFPDSSESSPVSSLLVGDAGIILREKFGVETELACLYLLRLLQEAGRLERFDGHSSELTGTSRLIFPVPNMLVQKPQTSVVFPAISACLFSHSVAVQEVGFILLSRYCFPHPSLQEGVEVVIRWLLDDSESSWTATKMSRNESGQPDSELERILPGQADDVPLKTR